MGPTALRSKTCAASHRLGDRQQVAQLEHEVPAWVVGTSPGYADRLRTRLERVQLRERLAEIRILAEDADESLRRRLQVALDGVRILGAGALQGCGELALGIHDLDRVDVRLVADLGGVRSRPGAG